MLLQARYGELRLPVTIVAGSGDLIANPSAQSNRLAHLLHDRDANLVEGAGHMVHYFAPERVAEAVTRRADVKAPALF